jgi:hypothetical protein
MKSCHLGQMDGPAGYTQNEVSHIKTNTLWSHLYVESENKNKNKNKCTNKRNKNRLIETEIKLMR